MAREPSAVPRSAGHYVDVLVPGVNNVAGRWTVLRSPEFREWYRTALADGERDAIVATVLRLQEDGPALRRPLSGITQAYGTRTHPMTDQFDDFQVEIDAALADPVRRARVEEFGRQIDLILALSAIREAVGLTQEEFASSALMSQENVSRIERATDVKLSTIRRLTRTVGAQLELTAVMPDGTRVPLLKPARPAETA